MDREAQIEAGEAQSSGRQSRQRLQLRLFRLPLDYFETGHFPRRTWRPNRGKKPRRSCASFSLESAEAAYLKRRIRNVRTRRVCTLLTELDGHPRQGQALRGAGLRHIRADNRFSRGRSESRTRRPSRKLGERFPSASQFLCTPSPISLQRRSRSSRYYFPHGSDVFGRRWLIRGKIAAMRNHRTHHVPPV